MHILHRFIISNCVLLIFSQTDAHEKNSKNLCTYSSITYLLKPLKNKNWGKAWKKAFPQDISLHTLHQAEF